MCIRTGVAHVDLGIVGVYASGKTASGRSVVQIKDTFLCFSLCGLHYTTTLPLNENEKKRENSPYGPCLGGGGGVGGGGRVLPEKLGWGVQPTYQNPYPIYDQNL